MTRAPGTRLGPYEIVGPLGAGGMGEVFRGRDRSLGRDVALKVLPSTVSRAPERLRRFEQEAKAASALNHPSLVTVHAIGSDESGTWIAMELVEGKTLRQVLQEGPLPIRKLLDVGAQIADGLAHAHAAGIVHRDLKPENVMLRNDGFVKILDFGLAKLTAERPSAPSDSQAPTQQQSTESGIVLGTAGYMSPEQASGRAVDFRTDQFSFGALLYELAVGRRAFQRPTQAQTLAAIIQDEPEPIASLDPKVPAPLRWLVERCLAKEPARRYASTHDLARELATLRDHVTEALGSTAALPAAPDRRPARRAALAAGLLALVAVGSFAAGRRTGPHDVPRFQRLTFRRGMIRGARFAPDEKTIVYGANWDGTPPEIYTTRLEGPESRSLGVPNARLFSVSAQGDLAVGRVSEKGGGDVLTQVPLGGGAPRPLLDGVRAADWTRDGKSLAIVRGGDRIELPPGNVIFRSKRRLSEIRISPSGDRVAVLEVDGDGNPEIVVVDLQGKERVRSRRWKDASGPMWSPDGREVWFSASEVGSALAIRAMDGSGRVRQVAAMPGIVTLHDVSRDGRVLLSRETYRMQMVGLLAGQTSEQDLSWLDGSLAESLSADGSTLLFTEVGEGSGARSSVYLRRNDGGPAVRLAEGRALALSPDGRWALAEPPAATGATVLLVPTGAGEPRTLSLEPVVEREDVSWFPDGRAFTVSGSEKGHPARCWSVDVATGTVRPLTPEGVVGADGSALVSPDGRDLLVVDRRVDGKESVARFTVSDGSLHPVTAPVRSDRGWTWSEDGRSLFAHEHATGVTRIFRFGLGDGSRVPLRELALEDRAGVIWGPEPVMTANGKWYAYSYTRLLGDLYVAEGLR